MIVCCKEALELIAQPTKDSEMWKKLLLFVSLADAAEAQGKMWEALDFDQRVKKVWREGFKGDLPADFLACHRREALDLLAVGKPYDAVALLRVVEDWYMYYINCMGINLMGLPTLESMIKVLATAKMRRGADDDVVQAGLIRAEVAETEAILSAYWEGVLEETRRELGERRAATALVGHAAGVALQEAGQEGWGGKKKSKAARRKQQKRKAQQQKKAEAAQAAVEGGAGRGGEFTPHEQGGDRSQEPQQEPGEGQEEEDEDREEQEGEEEGVEGGGQEAAVVAALSAMKVGGTEGEGGEEEMGTLCAVCLCDIDTANPTGPPLLCVHRYHASCLHLWVENCARKCLEVTCPECRSPLPETDSN